MPQNICRTFEHHNALRCATNDSESEITSVTPGRSINTSPVTSNGNGIITMTALGVEVEWLSRLPLNYFASTPLIAK